MMIYFLHELSKKNTGEREGKRKRGIARNATSLGDHEAVMNLRLDETNVVQDSKNVRREREREMGGTEGRREKEKDRTGKDG